jgi:hypothetical protein
LYAHLVQHPNVLGAQEKEVHFFDTPDFAKGINWYRAHFELRVQQRYSERVAGRKALTGEASPYYMFYPHAAERIANALPNVKLIVMLRNPVDRALSHYYHQVRKGREPLTFEAALDAEAERLGGEYERMLKDKAYYSFPFWAYSYLARGIYVDQLRQWLSLFPRQQFLFIKSEDFFLDPAGMFRKTLCFLGLPPVELIDYKKRNTGTYTSMPRDVRHRLSEHFWPYNERLYRLLDIDFAWETESHDADPVAAAARRLPRIAPLRI